MSRESYASRPQEVEAFPVTKGTDIILRKNIEKATKEPTEEGGKPYTVWECDELQCRTTETVTVADVANNFDAWWAYAENYKAEEGSTDTEADTPSDAGVTFGDRLDAIEAAISELAEVMSNG